MSFRFRLFTATALLAAAAPALTQPSSRPRPESLRLKPSYGYFKFRVPELRFRRDELRKGMLGNTLDRLNRVLDRRFALEERLRERGFALKDRAFRRQFEARDRAMSRLRERLNRVPKLRPFVYRRHLRNI